MNRRAWLASVLLASLAAACNGGSSRRVIFDPPPPTGNFTNSDLNGQYAFSMAGTEDCAGFSSFFARIGSFSADGNGRITGGVEDINACTANGVRTRQFTTGTYSIQADGRGTLALTNGVGTTNYSITLATASEGNIIQTDVNATASGSFQRQNPAAFSITQFAGHYVFDFAGLSVNVVPESIIGRFTADGGGGISQGRFDDNEDGTPTGPFSFTGSYLLDPVFAQDGRGTADIAGQNLIFYIVDATRLKFLSSDADFPAALVGEAFEQRNQNMPFRLESLTGSFAFLIGGASTTGPIATAGRFTADGAGNLSAVVLDENNNGGLSAVPTGTVAGTYTVDSDGLGGGFITWTDSTAGTFEFVFYLASPTRAVFQETDTSITSDGTFFGQTTSPISNASLAADYAFIWTGVEFDTGNEEDFVGQLELTSASSNNATGVMDFNNFGQAKQFLNFPITGALTLGSNPAARNTFRVATNAPPNASTPFRFSAYVVDANTVLLVGDVDPNSLRVIAGSLSRQP